MREKNIRKKIRDLNRQERDSTMIKLEKKKERESKNERKEKERFIKKN